MSEWGRVAEDGTVYLRTAEGERVVGSFAGDPQQALKFYAARYDALAAEVGVLEQRLNVASADPRAIKDSAGKRLAALDEAAVVGDVGALRARLDAVIAAATTRLAEQRAHRAEERERVTAAKQALVEEAETLAQSNDWKRAGERLRLIVEEWSALRGGDRTAEQALWRRLSTARREFGHRRSVHFSALDDKRKEARAAKEQLCAEAESLTESSDWKATGEKFRTLMGRWKAAGSAGKTADTELWDRFTTARDLFFSRRAAASTERDAELARTLEQKEALLARAEAIDATSDLDAARRVLREIQDKWRALGPVPRDQRDRLDDRLAAVEQRIKAAAEQRWLAPRIESSPLVTRLRESITKLEARAARARAAGDEAAAREAEEALATQRDWLQTAERSRVSESR